VHRRVDPRIDFPVSQRIDAAYIFHWNRSGSAISPDSMPPYRIHWTGLLRASRPGTYGFAIDAQGEARLAIDGMPLETQPAPSRSGCSPPAGIRSPRLQSGATGGRAPDPLVAATRRFPASGPFRRPRPGSRRHRPRGHPPDSRWLLVAAGAAAVAGMLYLSHREGSAGARLRSLVRSERVTLALGAILILAAVLRFHDYALVPFHHETADEYQHAWEG